MKIRVFLDMDDSVFRIAINTEDWSEGDITLMEQFGEPEVDVGGTVQYVLDGEAKSKDFGSQFVRVLHGFPYARGFDRRDYDSYEEAIALGGAWKDMVVNKLRSSVSALRSNASPLPTEEVSEL